MTALPSSSRTSDHVRYRPGCPNVAGNTAVADIGTGAAMPATLEQLFDAHARDGHIDVEYRTRAFAGTLS